MPDRRRPSSNRPRRDGDRPFRPEGSSYRPRYDDQRPQGERGPRPDGPGYDARSRFDGDAPRGGSRFGDRRRPTGGRPNEGRSGEGRPQRGDFQDRGDRARGNRFENDRFGGERSGGFGRRDAPRDEARGGDRFGDRFGEFDRPQRSDGPRGSRFEGGGRPGRSGGQQNDGPRGAQGARGPRGEGGNRPRNDRFEGDRSNRGDQFGAERSGRDDRFGSDRPRANRPGNDRFGGSRAGGDRSGNERFGDGPPRGHRFGGERSGNDRFGGSPRREGRFEGGGDRPRRPFEGRGDERPPRNEGGGWDERGGDRRGGDRRGGSRLTGGARGGDKRYPSRYEGPSPRRPGTDARAAATPQEIDGPMRLNRFLARAGVAARRKADELIASGAVTVNGAVVTEMGSQVQPGDAVAVHGRAVSHTEHVYLLFNKPDDVITTKDDDKGRETVLDFVDLPAEVKGALFPVGRLDRHTTGVLLLTTDGELAHRLLHPSYEVAKVYRIRTRETVKPHEVEQLKAGVALDDGPARPDQVGYIALPDYHELGMSLHEGRNRIVRRMVEAIGHEVVELERVRYAGLTFDGVRRGKWRRLTAVEVKRLRRLVRL